MPIRHVRILLSLTAFLASLPAVAAPLPAAVQEVHEFNVTTEDSASAIRQFSKQSGLQILASADDLKGRKLNPVRGSLPTEQAVNTMLLGTGLDHRYVGDRSVALVAAAGGPTERAGMASPVAHVPQAAAQSRDDSASTLEAVVVTANRREENQQAVGISVATYGGDELRQAGVSSSVTIAQSTPGVFVSSSFGGTDAQYSIRGVTQNDFGDTAESPVAVYIDDDYVPTLQGQNFSLFDISRVEVLKGPQGTLFGRNATGGLVQFVINKPTSTADGFMNVTYGAFDNRKVEAAFADTIAGDLTGRASFYYDTYGPIFRNVYPSGEPASILATQGAPLSPCCQDQNTNNTVAGRLQLQYRLADNLTVRWTGSFVRQATSSNQGYSTVASIAEVNPAGAVVNSFYASPTETRTAIGPGGANYTGIAGSPPGRLPGASWFGFIPPSINDLEVSEDFALAHGNLLKSGDTSLHIDYDFGSAQLTAITDYTDMRKNFAIDVDMSPVNFATYATIAQTHSLSQEVRLSDDGTDLKWTAGLYYIDIVTNSLAGFGAPENSLYAGAFGMSSTGLNLLDKIRQDKRSYSVFGQLDYQFAAGWNLVLGARALKEDLSFDFGSEAYLNHDPYNMDTTVPLFPLLPSYANHHSNALWAGKAELEYHLEDNVMLYTSINRGVKGGGYNVQLPDGSAPLPANQIPYRPETLYAYEVGAKSTLAGGNVVLNGDAFYYDYRDYQAFTFQGLDGVVQNRNARTYGAELSIEALLTRGLKFNGGASVTHAVVANLEVASGIFADVQPTFAPRFQASARLQYLIPARIAGGDVTVSVDANYQSSFYDNIRNFEAERLSPYFLANANVGWEKGRWRVGAAVSNLLDKRYASSGFDQSTACGCTDLTYGDPRWWTVQVSLKL